MLAGRAGDGPPPPAGSLKTLRRIGDNAPLARQLENKFSIALAYSQFSLQLLNETDPLRFTSFRSSP